MKLGTETRGQPEPVVGMGATILMWTDRHACTIVDVNLFKSGDKKGKIRSVSVQRDTATRADKNGFCENQEYTYAPNPKARVQVFTVNTRGAFKGECGQLRLGERDEYHDYSF